MKIRNWLGRGSSTARIILGPDSASAAASHWAPRTPQTGAISDMKLVERLEESARS